MVIFWCNNTFYCLKYTYINQNHKKINRHSCRTVFGEIRAFRRTGAALIKKLLIPHNTITLTPGWVGAQVFSHGKRASITTVKIAKSVLAPKPSYDLFARSRRYVNAIDDKCDGYVDTAVEVTGELITEHNYVTRYIR